MNPCESFPKVLWIHVNPFAVICEISQDFGKSFTRLWERIHKTVKGFTGILKDLLHFGKGFASISDTLEKDSCNFGKGFVEIHGDSQWFTRLREIIHETLGKDLQDSLGFMTMCKTLGKDLWGFVRLWKGFVRFHESFGKDFGNLGKGFTGICKGLEDFGKEFTGIHETLVKDSWGFMRIWEMIHKKGLSSISQTSGKDLWDSQGFRRLCESCRD